VHENDGGHRLLFAHPRMIESLIREFVPEEWVEELDFTTLERVNASYVAGERKRWRRREGDMVWKARTRDGQPVYLYLLIEFQSTVDRYMIVRVMEYVSLLYQDLIARGELLPGGKLPLVIPLVAYNGNQWWSAPRSFAELVCSGFPGADIYLPELRYRLVDEKGYAPEDLERRGGLVPLLFWLGMQDAQALLGALPRLRRRLDEEGDPSLSRAFLLWFRHLVGQSVTHIPKLLSLEEYSDMWEKAVKRWEREFMREGRKEGRKEGAENLLVPLIERKFGPLDRKTRARVHRADTGQLLQWGERLLTADRLEEVFAD
jgi:predicted transposase YdaD